MRLYLMIALAGSVGAMARFWMINAVHTWFSRDFPYGTFAVNVLGSALMGFLGVWLTLKLQWAPEYRVAVLTGFLGAFTTMSTFSIDSLNLIERNEWVLAGLYIVGTVVLCLVAARGGMLLAERI
ncbi:fluoride efflux transporter CrcB [Halothiobacillus sp. DCM-1]|uniref:fluoride efflux transporter CrcB n=1 Tax=Halothiobacillus sp. DCM-1 TaxID=3112558 RepID=UPI0032488DEB